MNIASVTVTLLCICYCNGVHALLLAVCSLDFDFENWKNDNGLAKRKSESFVQNNGHKKSVCGLSVHTVRGRDV